VDIPVATNFESVAGQGVKGQVKGQTALLGNEKLLTGAGISIEPLRRGAETESANGRTVVFLAVDGRPAGLLSFGDEVKKTSAQALQELRDDGVEIVMVTGDHEAVAKRVAHSLGITKVHAGVLPEEKLHIVRTLQAEWRLVAVAGDGINDAPALAKANVGIAMGNGTDVAIESAGVTLLKGDLLGIVRARKLSRETMQNVRQNLFFAFFYNALGIPLAAGALYPVFGYLLNPMFSAAAMSLSSLSVIANALRLSRAKV
jgi:Cu+-exporting ATPase